MGEALELGPKVQPLLRGGRGGGRRGDGGELSRTEGPAFQVLWLRDGRGGMLRVHLQSSRVAPAADATPRRCKRSALPRGDIPRATRHK